jgi:transcriptional regulator with XRE-family HTH domain
MTSRSSPSVRRLELGRQLRRRREASGLSLEDVAEHLMCSPSKISRIETGARSASQRDVRDLCRLYEVNEADQSHLMDLSREAKQRGWWQSYDEIVPGAVTYTGYENAASAIQAYESIVVPGLLQIPDYTRALTRSLNLRRRNPQVGEEAADQYASTRQRRQERLLEPNPPHYWVILDEAVLHRQVGGPKTMHDQLAHLAGFARDQHVILQIIPFTAGAHAGMEGGFTILHFENDDVPTMVFVESRGGHLYLSRDADIEHFEDDFDHLRAAALNLDDSVDLLERMAVHHLALANGDGRRQA